MNQQMKGINHQLADPNDPPEDPKAAATVLLVRDKKPEGIEVFLIERADQSGALDVEDKCLRVESGGVLSGTFRSEAGQKCLKWQRYIDPKLIKVLREFVKAYKETNN